MTDEADPGHLRDRHRVHGDEIFCGRVEQGEAHRGKDHQPDRLQPLARVGDGG
jgi:hypothetical protein